MNLIFATVGAMLHSPTGWALLVLLAVLLAAIVLLFVLVRARFRARGFDVR